MEKILLSGEIGWEVTPREIINQLDEAAGVDLDVHIASPGGSVLDGIEIFNAFRDYKRKYPQSQIMATIKGLAASMASYLAMNPAFDLIAAEDNAVFMIHNVWGGTVGDYREMKKTAEIFEGLTDIIADAYSRKTGKNKKDLRKMMDEESWFFGTELSEAGFVDEIIQTNTVENKSQVLAKSKLEFRNMTNKIAETKIDIYKIAAMIKPEEIVVQPIFDKTLINLNAHNPATNAGNNKTEEKTMTLEQLMAENPTAKIELDKMLNEKFEAGKKEAAQMYESRIEKASKFLDSDAYPKQIKDVAVNVMKGANSMETLDTMVASVDMFREMNKSVQAQLDTTAVGDTPGEQPPAISENGEIKSTADFQASVERLKAMAGVEVR